MVFSEKEPDEALLEALIKLSKDWEAENICRGYRANTAADIEGNRIFTAEEDGSILAYLFGYHEKSKNSSSVMPEGTDVFEVEELYVRPERRSQGIGRRLFEFAENSVRNEADYILLSTATKNFRAILHFYVDELDMSFWNARLFKKLKKECESR
ncbi:MAG: GNAT family N-acetyltransferase [Firmicutes bacterium]|nr:GNAT family N-acetyltransferase [Bacillota bacterium]